MDVGVVKVAEDQDFEKLKELIDDHTGWKLDYNKSSTKVWTKSIPTTSFKMIKVPSALMCCVYDIHYTLSFTLNVATNCCT
jgi:hypothetical protein